MNIIQKLTGKVDNFQRAHKTLAFPYGVVKKYGDDNGGYQAAIITYYGFLSLFPLLIVFTTLTQLLLKNDPALKERVINSVTQYFPIVGDQLQNTAQSPSKTGVALVISLLVILYGARGGANALQYALSNVWHVPVQHRPSFFLNMARSFGIIVVGGMGLVGAAVISGYTNILGHGFGIRLLASLISIAIIWLTFILVSKLAIAGNQPLKKIAVGAMVAAVGIQLLQVLGGVILGHQLKGLHNLYGTFALVIGMLFWIYLQAQVVLYAAEVDVVRAHKLYPRGLQKPLTPMDKEAIAIRIEALLQDDALKQAK